MSRVDLFVTCLVDTVFPSVGRATVDVLERLGVRVDFRGEQTCCGQMHYNSGYLDEATLIAERYGQVFAGTNAIVVPSASCAGHIRHVVPVLAPESAHAAARTHELTQFLTDELGVSVVGSGFSGRVAYHPTCHSLRVLRLEGRPRSLLDEIPGIETVDHCDPETCCGFGGTFAVKNPAVSGAMLGAKLDAVEAVGVDWVCACDSSCLMHLAGGLARRRSPIRAVHLAEILAA